MGRLSPELVDLVIDSLSGDWRALAACAHVHPDWAPRARAHLRSGVVLVVDWPECTDMDDFVRVFSSSSSLIPHISVLSICGPPHTSHADLLPLPETLTLDHLPCLRSLTLRSVLVSNHAKFMESILRCAKLEELHFEGISVDISSLNNLIHLTTLRPAPAPSSSLVNLPQLKTLRIRDLEGAATAPITSRLSLLFKKALPPVPIQSLSLHFYASPRGVDNMQIDSWYEPILKMQDTLTDIAITVTIPFHMFPERASRVCILRRAWYADIVDAIHPPDSDLTRFPTAIVRCRHLRRLVLRYKPLWAQETDPASFINALCLLFAPIAARGTNPDAFQNLGVLTLILPHTLPPADVPSYQRELVRFARVLATRNAFPALADIRVGLECACDDPTPDMAELTASALQPFRDRGLGTNVAGLLEDEWEAWCTSPLVDVSQ